MWQVRVKVRTVARVRHIAACDLGVAVDVARKIDDVWIDFVHKGLAVRTNLANYIRSLPKCYEITDSLLRRLL